MGRIRTVKPEFFIHHELYKLDRDTKLPCRLSFIALWTVADREGRFQWRPEELKATCMPHDVLDFSRVLDALESRGFIHKYASGKLGCIPSWLKHQVINNKERPSCIISPTKEESDAWASRGDALTTPLILSGGEGKGKERKGKEGVQASPEFEAFWKLYPFRKGKKVGKQEALSEWNKILPTGEILNSIMAAVELIKNDEFPKDAHRWLAKKRWVMEIEPKKPEYKGPSYV